MTNGPMDEEKPPEKGSRTTRTADPVLSEFREVVSRGVVESVVEFCCECQIYGAQAGTQAATVSRLIPRRGRLSIRIGD